MRLIDADALITWFNNYYDDEEMTVGYVSGLIKDAPTVEPEPQWRPIKTRPMDEEERKEWSERLGYNIEYEGAIIYMNLPDDGEEVLTCNKWGHICKDIFRQDEGCYFEDNGDMDGIIAWMPLPEPYKEDE